MYLRRFWVLRDTGSEPTEYKFFEIFFARVLMVQNGDLKTPIDKNVFWNSFLVLRDAGSSPTGCEILKAF